MEEVAFELGLDRDFVMQGRGLEEARVCVG